MSFFYTCNKILFYFHYNGSRKQICRKLILHKFNLVKIWTLNFIHKLNFQKDKCDPRRNQFIVPEDEHDPQEGKFKVQNPWRSITFTNRDQKQSSHFVENSVRLWLMLNWQRDQEFLIHLSRNCKNAAEGCSVLRRIAIKIQQAPSIPYRFECTNPTLLKRQRIANEDDIEKANNELRQPIYRTYWNESFHCSRYHASGITESVSC